MDRHQYFEIDIFCSIKHILNPINKQKCSKYDSFCMALCRSPLILIALLTFLKLGWSTSMINFDLPQLITKSKMVVQAQLTNKESHFRNGHIWTTLTFQINNFLKGDGPSLIKVIQPGGRIAKTITAVAGTRRFELNENYCLFLWAENNQSMWQIIGLSQGTFKVRRVGTDWLLESDKKNYSLYLPTIMKSQLKVQLQNENSRLTRLKAFYAKRSVTNLKSLIEAYD